MSVGRQRLKLQPDWLMRVHNPKEVILVSYIIKFQNSIWFWAFFSIMSTFYNSCRNVISLHLCLCPRMVWRPSTTHLLWEREAPPAIWPRQSWSSYCRGMSSPARTTPVLLVRFTMSDPLVPPLCSVVIQWSRKDDWVSIPHVQKRASLLPAPPKLHMFCFKSNWSSKQMFQL